MRFPRPQFRLRSLVVLVALGAIALEVHVMWRRSKPTPLAGPPAPGTMRFARLWYDGEWDIDPLAIPHLMTAIKQRQGYTVSSEVIAARDPMLVYFPLLYLHGRGSLSLSPEDVAALKQHVDPGGGMIFADATCGSPTFDAAFRRLVAELVPDHALVPIPVGDELYTDVMGYDLSDTRYNRAAGGGRGYPQLEGVKLNGRWVIVYSRYGIGCALERDHDSGCKGYTHESAIRISTNVFTESTLP